MPVAVVGFLFLGLYTAAHAVLVSHIDQLDPDSFAKPQRQ